MIQAKYFSIRMGSLFPLLPLFVLLFFLSCEEKMEKPDSGLNFTEKLTCKGCHTDQSTLEELAPGIDEPPPSSGGG